jgi:hypothetical protein
MTREETDAVLGFTNHVPGYKTDLASLMQTLVVAYAMNRHFEGKMLTITPVLLMPQVFSMAHSDAAVGELIDEGLLL